MVYYDRAYGGVQKACIWAFCRNIICKISKSILVQSTTLPEGKSLIASGQVCNFPIYSSRSGPAAIGPLVWKCSNCRTKSQISVLNLSSSSCSLQSCVGYNSIRKMVHPYRSAAERTVLCMNYMDMDMDMDHRYPFAAFSI